MRLDLLVPRFYSILTSLLVSALVFGWQGQLRADQPKATQDGSVEISLKLLPSAPEEPQEPPPVLAVKEPEKSSDQGSDPTVTATTESGSENPPIVNIVIGEIKDNKPSNVRKISDLEDSADGQPPQNSRPVKKSVRVLEISIEPATGPGHAARSSSDQVSNRLKEQGVTPPRQAKTEECPGGQMESNEEAGELPLQPGDIPLEQEEHPFDVPDAESTAPERRLTQVSRSRPEPAPRTVQVQDTKQQIENLLQHFREHPENVVRRGPWAIMHVILPFGVEAEVVAGNRQVNAIGWLCHNGVSARQRMFQPTQTGFRPNVGPGVQGHEGQFLAILAQSRVKSDYPIQVGKRHFSIRDLIRYEMATCREKTELTFKLIAFSHYLEPDQTWKDNRGRPWSIEKLVAEELAQPINGAACGGTHRLMGLTCAVVSRQEAGLPISGHFQRAQIFLDDFVSYTLTLQNPDGSFSTEWFERRANENSIDRKIQTTGHILEWLVYTLPSEHLQKPEITAAVQYLVETIGKQPSRDWPIGPRGHSLRALALYHQRLYSGSSLGTFDNGRVAAEPIHANSLR